MGFFGIISVPCMAYIKLKPIQRNLKKKKYKTKNRLEKIIRLFMNVLVPALVVINNNIGIFILTSILLIWKVGNFAKNFKINSIF